jgi:hypothetical protein
MPPLDLAALERSGPDDDAAPAPPPRPRDPREAAADAAIERALATMGPGWTLLRRCRFPGADGHAVRVRYTGLHPRIGVALVDLAPEATPDAAEQLRRRLEGLGFTAGTGTLPTIVYRVMSEAHLERLGDALTWAFDAEASAGGPAARDQAWFDATLGLMSPDDALEQVAGGAQMDGHPGPAARPAAAAAEAPVLRLPLAAGDPAAADETLTQAPPLPPPAPAPSGRGGGARALAWFWAAVVVTFGGAALVLDRLGPPEMASGVGAAAHASGSDPARPAAPAVVAEGRGQSGPAGPAPAAAPAAPAPATVRPATQPPAPPPPAAASAPTRAPAPSIAARDPERIIERPNPPSAPPSQPASAARVDPAAGRAAARDAGPPLEPRAINGTVGPATRNGPPEAARPSPMPPPTDTPAPTRSAAVPPPAAPRAAPAEPTVGDLATSREAATTWRPAEDPRGDAAMTDRMVTSRGANLRAGPEGGAPILGTVGSRKQLRVFAQSGDWLQVGEDAPQGWVHNSRVEIERAMPGPSRAASPPSEAPPATGAALAPPVAFTGSERSPELALRELQLDRGRELLARGDISGARLLFERAAGSGSGEAAIEAGRTYDPAVLAALGVRGIRPDPSAAIAWYRRAVALGELDSAEAALRRLRAASASGATETGGPAR